MIYGIHYTDLRLLAVPISTVDRLSKLEVM